MKRQLFAYGDMHFRRKGEGEDLAGNPLPTLAGLIERAGPTKVFSIWTNTITELATVQADVAAWRAPSLAIVRRTVFGRTDFSVYPEEASGFSPAPGQPPPAAPSRKPPVTMEEQFDAILYLGPLSAITESRISRALR